MMKGQSRCGELFLGGVQANGLARGAEGVPNMYRQKSEVPLFWTRDPEDRLVDATDLIAMREKALDKTIADSFPASDPPSSLPNPAADCFAIETKRRLDREISDSA